MSKNVSDRVESNELTVKQAEAHEKFVELGHRLLAECANAAFCGRCWGDVSVTLHIADGIVQRVEKSDRTVFK